jgi:hypothetical protein
LISYGLISMGLGSLYRLVLRENDMEEG